MVVVQPCAGQSGGIGLRPAASPPEIANGIGNPESVIDNFIVAVPEPSTWAMLLAGVGLFGVQVLRRRRSA